MIKKYCDICKKEIETTTDHTRPYYRTRSFNIDFCDDCGEKWIEFRDKTQRKYEKEHEKLDEQERKEIYEFLGIDELQGKMEVGDDWE